MTENTSIAWTRHSGNFWEGCTKVNAACANCYMYTGMKRWGKEPTVVRRTSDANWRKFFKWDRAARESGEIHSVFVNSWSDFCLPEADGWRPDAWEVIRNCVNLRWLILTKRPERIGQCLPPDWGAEGYSNVAWGASVHDQPSLEFMLPELLEVRAQWRFVSYEPGLGAADFSRVPVSGGYVRPLHGARPAYQQIDWLIVGGESGSIGKARPFEEEWARSAIAQCRAAGVPVFIKQMGSRWARSHGAKDRKGEDPEEWPEDLRVRELPWEEVA